MSLGGGVTDEAHYALRQLGFTCQGMWLWQLKADQKWPYLDAVRWATIRCNAEGRWLAWFSGDDGQSDAVPFDTALQAAVWIKLEVTTRWS